jgi:hypothetical protein
LYDLYLETIRRLVDADQKVTWFKSGELLKDVWGKAATNKNAIVDFKEVRVLEYAFSLTTNYTEEFLAA